MTVILIIVSYIITIFLGRYLDIKAQTHKDPIHYKKYIMYEIWFIPLLNILFPLFTYLGHEINIRKLDIKHNRFINWFFLGVNYETNHEKYLHKEFDEFFNKTRSVDSNTIDKVREQLKYTEHSGTV